MITFSRTLLVGAEFLNEATLRLYGILEDNIYAMEIQVDLTLPDGIIIAIQGRIKRYTTPVCPKSLDVIQKAVGMSFREEGWMSKVNNEIGRKGCRHLAEILIECGRCFDSAKMAKTLHETLNNQHDASPSQITRSWVENHPEVQGSCIGRQ